MKKAFTKLTHTVFTLLLVILVNHCSGSPGKADTNKHQVHTVSISDMKFQPDQIEISKGDTVIWKNNDLVAHNVTEFPDKKWSSPLIPSGGSWKIAVNQSSDYYCSIHPVMKGKIVVK